MLYHAKPEGWAWVVGRVSFFLVLLTVAALCSDVDQAPDAVRGSSCGVAAIGVLSTVHALRITNLTLALPLGRPRRFGPFSLPFPRTIGLTMSWDKLNILAGVALASLVQSLRSDGSVVWPSWARAILFCVVMAAVVISQTRGVCFTALSRLFQRRLCCHLRPRGIAQTRRTPTERRYGPPRHPDLAERADANE